MTEQELQNALGGRPPREAQFPWHENVRIRLLKRHCIKLPAAESGKRIWISRGK